MGQVIKCENCGANLGPKSISCIYCGASIHPDKPDPVVHSSAGNKPGILTLKDGQAEFGVSGSMWIFSGLALTVFIYGFGWMYEDTQYWLNTNAMIVWSGLLPAWLLFFASILHGSTGRLSLGIVTGLTISLLHMAIMYLLRGRINDDMAGISIFIGALSLSAWITGRLIHRYIRLIRTK